MKVDAKVVFKGDKAKFECEKLTMAYDKDYCEDFDDVIQDLEVQMFGMYGVPLHYKVDFEIENADAICAELEK